MSNNHKLTIVFYVNGMAFDGNTLKNSSLGGSETAGLCMAREMANRGHDVTMFCRTTNHPEKIDGVRYMPIETYQAFMAFTVVDVAIVQRQPRIFSTQTKAKINILWQHDLALKRSRGDFRSTLWNVDEVWTVSDMHKEQIKGVYGVPDSLFYVTRNGLDPIAKVSGVKRHPKRLIYTARPERGMDILLRETMPRLWKTDPDIELHLAGYDNTVKEMAPFYDSLKAMVAQYQKEGRKVKWLGGLTKAELYKEYQQATVYAYPTNFEEVSCITAMECMANGLPFVANDIGALSETLSPVLGTLAATLISKESGPAAEPLDAASDEFQERFCSSILSYLNTGQAAQESAARAGKEFAATRLWSDLATDWEQHIYELFEKRTANHDTVAQQFYRNEDIVALRGLADRHGLGDWATRVKSEYPLFGNHEAYRKVYLDYGTWYKGEVAAGRMAARLNVYGRIQVAVKQMAKPSKILDFAGAVGSEAIHFVNTFDCDVVTVNVSEDEQSVGYDLAAQHCKAPEKIKWVVGDTPADIEGTFDTVFAGEILEHIPNPETLIDALETKCEEGGKMVFTVPLGPWGDTDNVLNQKGHLWNFERRDLKDLFDTKEKLSIMLVSGDKNPYNGETLGWWVVSYVKRSANKTGTVNLDRKLALQAPRQTVSACMIVCNAEDMLYRCLNSIYPRVDEIVILLDKKSSDLTEALLTNYHDRDKKIKVLRSDIDPTTDGFDMARNITLDAATKDWVLWIDDDEALMNGVEMFKYLRHSMFNAYSIRQNHFSVNPPQAFKADVPMRLFRNNMGIKFFGMVHEHPETAINKSIEPSTILSDVDIAHDGYLTEGVRRGRFMRNYPLMVKDREKYPDRILGKFLMMRDQILLARYGLEVTKGQLNDEIIGYCEDVIRVYKADFMGKQVMMSSDGLAYYSEALRVLNRGQEFTFCVAVTPENDGRPIEQNAARFENKEAFMEYMAAQVDKALEPHTGKYV